MRRCFLSFERAVFPGPHWQSGLGGADKMKGSSYASKRFHSIGHGRDDDCNCDGFRLEPDGFESMSHHAYFKVLTNSLAGGENSSWREG